MRIIDAVTAAAVALALAACGKTDRDDMSAERADKLYQAAVADYTAGRIEEAAAGFEKAVRSAPGNASARFQLAVLLQDGRHDYLGAMCGYRDYLLLAPSSDKAAIAKARLEACEKLLAAEYAKKYGLGDGAAAEKEMGEVRAELEAKTKAADETAKKLAEAERRVQTLERETEKLRSILRRMGDDDEPSKTPPRAVKHTASPVSPAAVPEEDDAPAALSSQIANAAALVAEEDESEVKLNPEAKALFEAEEREEAERAAAGPSLLPAQTAENAAAVKLTDLGYTFGDGTGTPVAAPGEVRRYVVQEGETLGQIALKFYGRKAQWRRIQQANKATISSDGNVKAGQTIIIP